MENLSVTFLGTGNAVPTEKRNHTAILVSFKDENILIDCGEGTQRQFRKAQISPTKITRILITHWHGDHILGLPGLLQTLAMSEYSKVLRIYGPRGSKRYFSMMEGFLLNKNVKVEIHEVSGLFVNEKDFFIEAKEMAHGTPTNAYSIALKDKIRLDKNKLKKLNLPNSPLLKNLQQGKDITFNNKKIKASQVSYKEKGKKLTVILDTGMNQNAIVIAKDANLLITEATFSSHEEEQAKEYKHLTASQSAQIAKKAKAKALVLTHISQRYEHQPQIILKEARKTFKNAQLVNDLDTIVF